MKPIAYEIDRKRRNLANLPKSGGYKVRYKCPICGIHFTDFINYKDLKFCYSCGESIFWGGCIGYISSTQSDTLDKFYKEDFGLGESLEACMLRTINQENNLTDEEDMVYIPEEDIQ